MFCLRGLGAHYVTSMHYKTHQRSELVRGGSRRELPMIFRRIKAHVAKEDWFAVFIDFIIVVFGVFMGLQVQQWANDRSSHAEKISYLQAIHKDLDVLIPRVEGQIGELVKQTEAQKKLVELSVSLDKLPKQEELDYLMYKGLYNINILDPMSVSYVEMKEAGKLSLLNDPELSHAFQRLEGALADLERMNEEMIQITYDYADPFLVENYDVHGIVGPHGDGSKILLDQTKHRSDSTVAIKTRNFRNIVLYRASSVYTALERANATLDAYREINDLLESRLTESGATP